jgi:ABC-type branched-subunit amino acid transport system ATPase component
MPTSSADGARPAPRLTVEGLSAGYTDVPVVEDVSLAVAAGEKVVVVGPNGAGKSTVLKAIVGEIRVFGGRVLLDDATVIRVDTERLPERGLGYVPQVRDVFETLSVEENLRMGGFRLPRADVPRRVDEVLELFPNLAGMRDRVAGKLSGGERKMLAIARTLMLRPEVLILDEPSANLSPDLAQRVLGEYVCRLADSGVGVLLVEQRVREALAVADWGYVLVAGRNRLEGAPGDLLARDDLGEILLGAEAGPGPTQVDHLVERP